MGRSSAWGTGSRLRPRSAPYPAALALLPFLCAAIAKAGQHRLDEHITFLAHFDDNTTEADYAMGWKEFAGGSANLAEGYYGKAIDLRGIPFRPGFMASCRARSPKFNGFDIWPGATSISGRARSSFGSACRLTA